MPERTLTQGPSGSSVLPALVVWASRNARELVFAVGLALLSWGLALVFLPAAFIVTGGLLVWLAIPPTPRKPPTE